MHFDKRYIAVIEFLRKVSLLFSNIKYKDLVIKLNVHLIINNVPNINFKICLIFLNILQNNFENRVIN